MSIKGEINKEVINTLIKLMENIVGKGCVKVVLNRLKNSDAKTGRDIVYIFSEEAQNLLGHNGAFASLRQVGRDLAKSLMEKYPKEEWNNILKTALNEFGFAQKIEKYDNKAFICGCVFFDILDKNNISPTKHAVCWAGWGFIEGFVKEMYNIKGIKWVGRDLKENRCQFDFII